MSFLKIRKKSSNNDKNLSDIPQAPEDEIGITKDASQRIIELIKNEDWLDGYLRIAIMGGGCSGFNLHYSLCQQAQNSDKIFSFNNAKICIDNKSLKMLGGSTLHVSESLGAKEFVLVNNPFAKQCSCGKSFSL